jgi:hypothetical protein
MRFRLRTLLVVIALAALALFGLRWFNDYLDPFAGRAFDRDLWHEFYESDDPDSPRASMVKSLQRSFLHPGLTHDQVIELLGEPDLAKSSDMYEYNLGMWSGFRMDYDGLQVHFDSQGRLTHAQCVQH